MSDAIEDLRQKIDQQRDSIRRLLSDSTPRAKPSMPLAKPRKPRKPSIGTMIKLAEQAKKVVTSITTPDGFKIAFDPKDDRAIQTADDELAQWRAKRKRNAHSS